MIVLWIILAILAAILALVLFIILFGTVKVRIIYREKVKVKVGLWAPFITVVSDKPKKERAPSEPKICKDPDKVLARELKRKKKAEEKAAKKAAKKAEQKKKKARKKAEQKELNKQKKEQAIADGKVRPKPNVKENLEMILTLLKKLYAVTRGKFKLRLRRMYIAVGTGDAAQTAILYGVIVQSASYLLNFLNNYLIPMKKHEGEVNVYPDYTASKTTVDVDITCSFHIRSLLAMGIGLGLTFLTARAKALKKAAIRQKKKEAEKKAAIKAKLKENSK